MPPTEAGVGRSGGRLQRCSGHMGLSTLLGNDSLWILYAQRIISYSYIIVYISSIMYPF